MSSPDSEIQIHTRIKSLSPFALLSVLTVINVAALGVCFVASPWSESRTAAIVILLLSAVPLGLLECLSIRIYLTHKRIRRELDLDEDRSEDARLPLRAGHLHGE